MPTVRLRSSWRGGNAYNPFDRIITLGLTIVYDYVEETIALAKHLRAARLYISCFFFL